MSDLEVLETQGVRVLVARGELDLAVAPDLVARLPDLLDEAASVVLDLTLLTFFDSSGVRLVDALARACAERSVPWRLVVPDGSGTLRVLRLVGMLGPQVVADRATALKQLRGDT